MFKKFKRIADNLTALAKYFRIKTELAKQRELYFFFPSWSFGGAERVHVDIMNLFNDPKPLCFITDRSITDGFKKEFQAAADVIELGRWAEKKELKQQLYKMLAASINAQQHAVVSGWCSSFMYDLIPYLAPHVQIIDIMHNFKDDDDQAIERYSLPHVPRINKRIVVGNVLIQQFKDLYSINHIPEQYLERLTVIQNKIPFDGVFPEKNYEDTLQVLFVGRNSEEKRPNVFIRVAEIAHDLNLPIEFKLIGDFSPGDTIVPSNTKIVGPVHDKAILNDHYKDAHLLLLTSRRESWGLVVFEGMNMGVVPISTDVGELSNYISRTKENGIVVDNLHNVEDLALQFIKELEFFISNRAHLKTFSINAFNTVKQLYNNCDFDESYRKILSSRSGKYEKRI
ncbi:glycosyltransferase family 4 protein [Pedobacter frigoris]|uniref:Glycosyltransferase family 4 protein n=1 Tax=Pedobacter frigoris TaxID=2571272 RepID=A0A4U1C911_9SPHI|nr:glycosyltransferase family 4 protein [Pedobacter frigoris]TKC02912.1 glycosyltransferase family 4 protein [Pedobacter frigoris]